MIERREEDAQEQKHLPTTSLGVSADFLQTACNVGPVDPSFRALSGCLKFDVRRHKFDEDSLSFPRFLSLSGPSMVWITEKREANAQDEEHVRMKSPFSLNLRLRDLVRTCTESNSEEESVGLSSDFWRTACQAHSRRLQAQDDHKSVGNERRLLNSRRRP